MANKINIENYIKRLKECQSMDDIESAHAAADNGRFICTLFYKYCPLFPIDSEELVKFVLEKRPTLKGKPFRIAF